MPLKNSFDLPKFFTLSPPLSYFEDETVWLNLTNSVEFKPIYYNEAFPEKYSMEDIKKIATEAFKQTIRIHDQKVLLDVLEKDPDMIHKIGIKPSNISNIIEFNPSFAHNVLAILLKSTVSTDYLSAIIKTALNMSLNSLEVVNRLASSMELPTEFLHLYILNCIEACEKMTDERFQKRSVRILCVFLQSLVRKKKIDINDISIEIESFCITFSKIKEATELYKICKTF
ncbi:unnamed protein product [Chironomus riparius]|uniref:CCR4-NOT transcription complex subunit 11 n=1 Tax=Chironomus riparius TaxID=315576 RepID=A0A9N9WQ90_9DIPT|nr:unnamed protein product [Chironomus riparius]